MVGMTIAICWLTVAVVLFLLGLVWYLFINNPDPKNDKATLAYMFLGSFGWPVYLIFNYLRTLYKVDTRNDDKDKETDEADVTELGLNEEIENA